MVNLNVDATPQILATADEAHALIGRMLGKLTPASERALRGPVIEAIADGSGQTVSAPEGSGTA